MRRHIKTIQEKYRNLRKWERITLVLLVLAILAVVVLVSRKPESSLVNTLNENVQREVVLQSVADLSLDKEPLSLIGVVQSESQVDIRTEASGNVIRVAVKLGDQVGRGQTIAEIENSTERAAAAQARALVDASEAQLKTLAESFSVSRETIAVENARRTLFSSGLVIEPDDEESTLTVPKISGVYTDNESGIYRIYIDRGNQAYNYVFTLNGIEQIRDTEIIENELKSAPLGSFGLRISFSDDLENYVGTRWTIHIPNTRSSSYATNLNAYNSALDAQRSINDQIVAQRAQVESARANLAMANALLSKTIIRSPIAGTVNVLDIDLGEFVSVSTAVAEVANANLLEIKTYITEDDNKSLEVDLPVVVAGKYEGRVTSIAPAVNSATKKIEVSVSVDKEAEAELLNGQSVALSIGRKDVSPGELDQIFIPLSALKVTFEGVVVFGVDEATGMVQKHLVKEGPLVGDKVLILEGLTQDMRIIPDVRGINVGDVVSVVN